MAHGQIKESFKRYFARKSDRGPEACRPEAVREAFAGFIRGERLILKAGDAAVLERELIAEITAYGPLTSLFSEKEVTEIMVNGDRDVYEERQGALRKSTIIFSGEDEVYTLVERLLGTTGARVDESAPYTDCRLPDGSRVNVIVPPVSLDGPVITIRRFPDKPLRPEELVRNMTLSKAEESFLGRAVRAKRNIVVSGGTGTGKTTFLNALASYIPPVERLITIEDAAELKLPNPHVLRLQSRPPNIEGKGEITIRDLVRNALRMRPDRIIVGEARGGEALDMLQAMNTGHEGSMTTVHANSCADALRRLEVMVLMAGVGLPYDAVKDLIRASLDIILQLERKPDGRRRLAEIVDLKTAGDNV